MGLFLLPSLLLQIALLSNGDTPPKSKNAEQRRSQEELRPEEGRRQTGRQKGTGQSEAEGQGRREGVEEEPAALRHRLLAPGRGRNHELRRLRDVPQGPHQGGGQDAELRQGRRPRQGEEQDRADVVGALLQAVPQVPHQEVPQEEQPEGLAARRRLRQGRLRAPLLPDQQRGRRGGRGQRIRSLIQRRDLCCERTTWKLSSVVPGVKMKMILSRMRRPFSMLTAPMQGR